MGLNSVVVEVAEERLPLLESLPPHADTIPASDGEILPLPAGELPASSDGYEAPKGPGPKQRLVSLDVFRGLTVAVRPPSFGLRLSADAISLFAVIVLYFWLKFSRLRSSVPSRPIPDTSKLMILVDDAGGAFPSINHSPWTGATLADFVMPFFLFGVGVSVALVFKKPPNKGAATKKVVERSIKLFLLGLLLQGGYFHGRNHLTYGLDIDHIRWLGVLQRISIGYFFAGVANIWLASDILVDSAFAFVKRYYTEWIVAILLSSLYVGLLYGLYVPDWKFQVPHGSTSYVGYGVQSETVFCGTRGDLGPPCNAVGLVDRILLGEKHLYQRPVYRRTKECSTNFPDYGPLPPDAPTWCLAPFDPEGVLSSLAAAVTCFIGLQFGHVIVHLKGHVKIVLSWSMTSLMLLLGGYIMQILGLPLSKPLYTVSYMFVTAGLSGIVLTAIFCMVDVKQFRKPTLLLQWMGMNALIVYALAACELFPAAVQGFYWRSPENNLVNLSESLLQAILHSKRWGTLVFVLLEIIFWCLVAGYLHMKGIYIKL